MSNFPTIVAWGPHGDTVLLNFQGTRELFIKRDLLEAISEHYPKVERLFWKNEGYKWFPNPEYQGKKKVITSIGEDYDIIVIDVESGPEPFLRSLKIKIGDPILFEQIRAMNPGVNYEEIVLTPESKVKKKPLLPLLPSTDDPSLYKRKLIITEDVLDDIYGKIIPKTLEDDRKHQRVTFVPTLPEAQIKSISSMDENQDKKYPSVDLSHEEKVEARSSQNLENQLVNQQLLEEKLQAPKKIEEFSVKEQGKDLKIGNNFEKEPPSDHDLSLEDLSFENKDNISSQDIKQTLSGVPYLEDQIAALTHDLEQAKLQIQNLQNEARRSSSELTQLRANLAVSQEESKNLKLKLENAMSWITLANPFIQQLNLHQGDKEILISLEDGMRLFAEFKTTQCRDEGLTKSEDVRKRFNLWLKPHRRRASQPIFKQIYIGSNIPITITARKFIYLHLTMK